jgi:hypothetical protein
MNNLNIYVKQKYHAIDDNVDFRNEIEVSIEKE